MTKAEAILKIKNFENALKRLEEGVLEAKNELDKDGVIQRFEFTIEMLSKALRAILLYQGIEHQGLVRLCLIFYDIMKIHQGKINEDNKNS